MTSTMYPEFFLYPFAFLAAHGASILFAFKMIYIAITFMTTYIAYFSGCQFLSDKGGLLFAIAFVLNPFRMNDIYIRCALGEVLAMTFIPLIIAGFYQVLNNKKKLGIIETVIASTCILQSHLLSVLLIILFAVPIVLIILFSNTKCIKDMIMKVLSFVLSLVITASINLWFLLPLFNHLGDKFVISSINENDIEGTSIYLFQVIMDGYTGTAAGNTGLLTQGEMTYSIGFYLLLTSCIYILKTITAITQGKKTSYDKIVNICFGIGVIAIFIESNYFPWKWVLDNFHSIGKVLSKLQFAWRMQIVACVMLCIVSASVMHELYNDKKCLFYPLLLIVVLNACAASRGYLFLNPSYQNDKSNVVSNMIYYDYLYSDTDYLNTANILETDKLSVYDNLTDFNVISDLRTGLNYEVVFEKNTNDYERVIVPVLYSEYYKSNLNGNAIQYFHDSSGLCYVNICDSGRGVLKFEYSEPSTYIIANFISIICGIVFVIYIVKDLLKLKKNNRSFV